MKAGGWTIHETISDIDKEVFTAALSGLVGVHYEPMIAATQIVAGTNYIFLAKYTMLTLPPNSGLATIYIYVPLKGDPVLEKIDVII